MFAIKQNNSDFAALSSVARTLLENPLNRELVQVTVDEVLNRLHVLKSSFSIAIVALLSPDGKTLNRIAHSQTNAGQKLTSSLKSSTSMDFNQISTPMSASENLSVRCVSENKSFMTHSLVDLVCPPLDKDLVRQMQKKSQIKTSFVFPLNHQDKTIGCIIFSTTGKIERLPRREQVLLNGLCDIVSIAIINAKLFAQIEEDKNDLAIANRKLRELDDLKDDFISIVSHELRTPMTAIKNYLWLAINDQTISHKERRDYLNISYNSATRLIDLVNDMLTISRIEGLGFRLAKEIFNVNQIVADVHQHLAGIALDKKIDFTYHCDQQYALVQGDPKLFFEAVQNLVSNALKFTPSDGKVEIKVDVIDQKVIVRVTDTGCGIQKEDLPKLFTKFTKLEKSYVKNNIASTGLGLYFAQNVIKKHRGSITVTSEIDHGSTFEIRVPLVAANCSLSA